MPFCTSVSPSFLEAQPSLSSKSCNTACVKCLVTCLAHGDGFCSLAVCSLVTGVWTCKQTPLSNCFFLPCVSPRCGHILVCPTDWFLWHVLSHGSCVWLCTRLRGPVWRWYSLWKVPFPLLPRVWIGELGKEVCRGGGGGGRTGTELLSP